MKNRTIFLAIATVLLLLAGGIGINRFCQKTVPGEQPPRQKQLYPPFVYKPDSATRARWEKLNPKEQEELEIRKFEDYRKNRKNWKSVNLKTILTLTPENLHWMSPILYWIPIL